jgi:hypothetical protein
LGSVFRVAKLYHQVGDELVQQEVGELKSKAKTVDSHTELKVGHEGVAMDKKVQKYLAHKEGDCEYVEHDQVDQHHSVALLYLLVGVEQAADGQQGSGDEP